MDEPLSAARFSIAVAAKTALGTEAELRFRTK